MIPPIDLPEICQIGYRIPNCGMVAFYEKVFAVVRSFVSNILKKTSISLFIIIGERNVSI